MITETIPALTMIQWHALEACARGDEWCGLGLRAGAATRGELKALGLIEPLPLCVGGYRCTAEGLALLAEYARLGAEYRS